MIRYTQPENISSDIAKMCDESDKLTSTGKYIDSVAILEKAYSEAPDSRKVILKLASAYRNSGNAGKSIKILENALEKNPDDIEYHHQLANSYFERKWNKKAVAKFNECLESDAVYPEIIQDLSDYFLENKEHKILTERLENLMSDFRQKNLDTQLLAMCTAMIFVCADDSRVNGEDTKITADYLNVIAEKYPDIITPSFCADVISFMSDTPNGFSALTLFNELIAIMYKLCSTLKNDNNFRKACAQFEMSVIVYNADVNNISVYAMRAVNAYFKTSEYDENLMKYLIFSAKMDIVESARKTPINALANDFKNKYHCLWTFVSEFLEGIMNAKNEDELRIFARQSIYSDVRNPSKELIKTFEQHLNKADFELFKKAVCTPQKPSKPVAPARPALAKKSKHITSNKIAPNSECPCGSGKKYKKCCGLK